MHKNLMDMPVQSSPCKTCPFEGIKSIELSPERYQELIQNLIEGGNQFCHSANNTMICRGGRNITLRVFCINGIISEPTDEALKQAWKEHNQG